MKDATIKARINAKLKHDVEGIFEHLGLSTSQAIIIFFRQVKLYQGLPFPVRIPNKLTQKTLTDSAAGKNVKRFKNLDDLFEDLGI